MSGRSPAGCVSNASGSLTITSAPGFMSWVATTPRPFPAQNWNVAHTSVQQVLQAVFDAGMANRTLQGLVRTWNADHLDWPHSPAQLHRRLLVPVVKQLSFISTAVAAGCLGRRCMAWQRAWSYTPRRGTPSHCRPTAVSMAIHARSLHHCPPVCPIVCDVRTSSVHTSFLANGRSVHAVYLHGALPPLTSKCRTGGIANCLHTYMRNPQSAVCP